MLFTRVIGRQITIHNVYVDNIIIIENDCHGIIDIKSKLSNKLEIRDLRKLNYFLGIEVARSKTNISILQRKYILDLLSETGMFGYKPTITLVQLGYKGSVGCYTYCQTWLSEASRQPNLYVTY